MIKTLLLVTSILILVGCNSSESVTPSVVHPDLKECRFYKNSIDGTRVYVVRCPNSETSVMNKSGKSNINSFSN